VNNLMKDVMEVMLELLMNGFTIITLLINHALHIKLTAMIMVSDVQLKLNAETVSLIKDVGLNKELKFTELNNSVMSLDKKI
jgi:hypothetical protein